MTAALPGEEFTELVDADIPRVDLVGKAANGTRFLIAKAADDGRLTQPLIPADMVADLIAKAQEADPVTAPTTDVAKADTDVTELLATDAEPADGSVDQPGSPAWEAVDAATAQKWAGILSRAKAALCLLADREAAEAAVGDVGDGENVWDLDDAACAIDYAISLLAPYALGEQMEVELAEPSVLEAVGKAAAAVDAEQLGVVEALAPIAKAGRTLSAANETAIRSAVESLTKVLDSLPAAPAADAPVGEIVTKTEETPAVTAPAAEAPTAEPVDVLAKALALVPALTPLAVAETLIAGGRTQEVAKAKGDPQMAVFSADGKLVGVIDPADLNPIAATEAPAEGDTEGADDAPAADDAAAPADDTAAAADPADGQVIPGTDTVQAPAPAAADDDTQTPAVAKAADTARLEEQVASLAKQLAELAEDRDTLQETVRKMGLLPDDRRSPTLNGATGAAGAVSRDGSSSDPVADLRKAADDETDPAKKTDLLKQAFFAEVKARFA